MSLNEQIIWEDKVGSYQGVNKTPSVLWYTHSRGWKLSWLNSNDNFEINGKTEFLYQSRLGNELQN